MNFEQGSRLSRLNPKPTVFILWADKFDECFATICVTQLRRAGLRVKMVGLAGRQAKGLNGLMLGTDVALGEVLAMVSDTVCLIIPCDKFALRRLESDPRLEDFLRQVSQNEALVVLGHTTAAEAAMIQWQEIFCSKSVLTPPMDDMMGFAQNLAQQLLTTISDRRCGRG
ncbi:MAG: DJ-1/PfpI family protein [Chloroflexota bacterium]